MKFVSVHLLLAFCIIQVTKCVNPSDIVEEAKSHIGETKWSFESDYGTGQDTNKCNQFVYDVLDAVNADPPYRWYLWYSPIGAGEWGNPRSDYLTENPCWNTCTSWQLGDVISDKIHVAIITGNELTTSAASDSVVQNNWGFRSQGASGTRTSITACWSYTC